MALEAKRAAVNTAAIALEVALSDLIDGLSPGDILYFMFGQEWRGAVPDPTTGLNAYYSTTPATQTRYRYEIRKATSTDSNQFAITLADGRVLPLSFRITNEAGEIA